MNRNPVFSLSCYITVATANFWCRWSFSYFLYLFTWSLFSLLMFCSVLQWSVDLWTHGTKISSPFGESIKLIMSFSSNNITHLLVPAPQKARNYCVSLLLWCFWKLLGCWSNTAYNMNLSWLWEIERSIFHYNNRNNDNCENKFHRNH